MDITGTTAKEAATTIQGSIAMAKAAWTNWATGLMDDNADIKQLTQELIGSVKQVIENVAPRIGEFFDSLVESIHNALAEYPAVQEIFDKSTFSHCVYPCKLFNVIVRLQVFP